ncbi:MAG: MATE family efflux transporter [Planctomycetota bacterium]|nr:MATE family efflux transporter [Planctomycetota bacterium]MDA1105736.1 MATE family efflux transporter [Planctomycetota bacterium]
MTCEPIDSDDDPGWMRGTTVDPDDFPQLETPAEKVEASADARGKIRSGKLAGKSLESAIWILALPVLLQQLLAAAVGLVDKMLAGAIPDPVGVPALDAIGIGSYIGWFIGIAMTGLGVGTQAIIARSMGSGDTREANLASGQSIVLSLLWGTLVGAGVWLAIDPLMGVIELSETARHHCRDYVQIVALSMPFTGLMTVGSMALHGAGETTLPSVVAVVVNIVNVVASWLLSGITLSLGPLTLGNALGIDPTQWGVTGIAAGTAISYFVGAMMTLAVLWRGVKDMKPKATHLRPTRDMTWRVVRVGFPNFVEGIALWAVNLFVLRFIGEVAARGIGDAPKDGLVGAHMIAVQWEAFSFLPGFAIGTAAGTLAGQYLGAGNAVMARKSINHCLVLGMALMGVFGLVFILAGRFLTSLISDAPVHLESVPPLLLTCGFIQVFFAMGMVCRNGLRGVGDTVWILGITALSSYLVRLPLAWLFGLAMGWGLTGIWIGLCAELVVRGIAFWLRFRFGRWDLLKV